MDNKKPRIKREGDTVALMIELYCRRNHSRKELCDECAELLQYASQRLEKCPFGEGKTTCAKCPVHCYKPDMRQKIRTVMRYSGPRMLFRHPVMAFRHLMDGRRKTPVE
ncbi:MAG: nitrous oxide-stimulated promoter family protein [Chloroflexota bacterium]